MKFLARLIALIILTFCFVVLYGHGPSGFAPHAGQDAAEISQMASRGAQAIPGAATGIYNHFFPAPTPTPAPTPVPQESATRQKLLMEQPTSVNDPITIPPDARKGTGH